MLKRTFWKTLLCEEAEEGIYRYCAKRNYKCNGCKFSISKYAEKHSEYVTCMFANIPCSWFEEVEDETDICEG